MLTVRNLSILHNKDLRPLIQDLSFTLSGNERLAVIGEEGNGKSALLQAIVCPEKLGQWAEISGSVHYPGEKLGYLSQEAPQEWNDVPAYTLCMGNPSFTDMDPGDLAELCRKLSMDQELCWSDTRFGLLSGGEKVRLRLLLILCEQPTMLLLDEPGNDLDLDAILALERFLLTCNLPVLYVSHDEGLLQATATQVLHLESLHGRAEPRWTWDKEPYATYVQNRRNQLDRQEQIWKNEQRERQIQEEKFRKIEDAVARAQENISRRDPHGGRLLKKKMKAVKSLEHRYEREQESATERPAEEFSMYALFSDIQPVPNGKGVLNLELEQLRAGDRQLASGLRLQIRGSEKVLITGSNGTGKTTLLRVIEEKLREDSSLKTALMPQHYEDGLDFAMTPVEFLNTDGSKEQKTSIRASLIAMKFSRDELDHPIRSLSGGQKAKVLLLKLMMAHPDVLLMDEPTRNLSPLSAPVMRDMIRNFPGAVICVTHDRLLIRDWPGRVLRLTEQGLAAAETTENERRN
ncbi:MAG: ABC-F family ATP-binding cassette domain-containing protein [Clostridia bacterium]|nr:ABC-F family ATP-binding cassette domain-containing protein [Clostridia bacterium]